MSMAKTHEIKKNKITKTKNQQRDSCKRRSSQKCVEQNATNKMEFSLKRLFVGFVRNKKIDLYLNLTMFFFCTQLLYRIVVVQLWHRETILIAVQWIQR